MLFAGLEMPGAHQMSVPHPCVATPVVVTFVCSLQGLELLTSPHCCPHGVTGAIKSMLILYVL